MNSMVMFQFVYVAVYQRVQYGFSGNRIAPEEKTAEAESLTLREASCLHFSEKLALWLWLISVGNHIWFENSFKPVESWWMEN